MRTSRRLALLVLTAALPLAVVTPAVAAPDPGSHRPTPPPWLKVENGVSVPQFDLANAVEETLFVQTEVDSDLDGVRDRVRVRLSRPGETETQGIKVPVVFEHSPYRYNTGGGVNHNVDFSVLPQEGLQPTEGAGGTAVAPRPDLPGSLDNYWVPRGYAVVLGESIGTGFSDGCPTVGDMKETLGTKAVIDWLNGRAKAYTEAGEPVEADWTTGDVGMTGTSYNGTLPNQVATTGVEGLRTIVPVSAIASWYDYYRANGLVRAPHSNASGQGENAYQGEDLDVLGYYVEGPGRVEKCAHITDALLQYADRTTGDYNAYWHERDYLHRARGIKASVFVVHGLEDYNVMPTAYSSWWSQLERYDVPRKIWLHKGGHGGPGGASDYQRTLNRWMDYWLFGVRNGIMAEPRADVQRPDGTYEKYADWPAPGARNTTLRLSSPSATEPGALGRSGGGPRQSFVDSGRTLDTDVSLLPDPDTANPNRLVYLSAPLARDTHLSGTPSVSLRASVDNRYAANLTAVLVDYGPDGQTMVTRGWTDVQNRMDIDRSTPVEQGKEYTFDWPLESDDYVFPAGHRIGLVIVSTDMNFTLRPLPGTRLTVNPGKSAVTLPIVGGRL
ncbi:MAG: Xaa-Pro dipeptidyl-peptidase [Actinophytocola sp.]|uniref:Xaa-Pro dipeptidyl-peptidase n=1 Tax=Actinophytocola sp. TaxID=1872138 RepID=UPI003C77D58F